jgi:beta-lactamase superfamily II metal-dependent hydrolase
MKKLIFTIAALFAFMQGVSAQEYLPKWQEGYMDIHTIATGRGDATLVVMPDGTTLMIDAGDNGKTKDKQHPDTTKRAGEWQAIYMKHFMKDLPNTKVDYAMITHFHDDHMGAIREMLPGKNGYGLSGITLVGEMVGYDKLIDRNYPDYDFPSKKNVANANKKFMDEYHKFVKYQMSQGMEMERFDVGALNQIKMLYNPKKYKKNFEIRNLAGNGETWTGKGTESEKQYKGDPKLFDENVNSLAIRITYGNFKYFNGGDLSGGNWPSYKSPERDMETPVAKVCGKVDVIKANHHGYYETCNGFFMNTLSPDVVIVDARSDNHPVPSTMTRMTDPLVWTEQGEYYITVDQARGKLGEELWSHFKPWGHIVVRVYEGGEKYQVFVLDADSLDYPVIYKSDIKTAGK